MTTGVDFLDAAIARQKANDYPRMEWTTTVVYTTRAGSVRTHVYGFATRAEAQAFRQEVLAETVVEKSRLLSVSVNRIIDQRMLDEGTLRANKVMV